MKTVHARVDELEKQKIAVLSAQGKSKRSIGQILHRDGKTIALALRRDDVQVMKETAAKELSEMFTDVARRALEAIDDEKLMKSSARDLGVLSAVCVDKQRLISGESTSNQAIAVLISRAVSSVEPTAGAPLEVDCSTI